MNKKMSNFFGAKASNKRLFLSVLSVVFLLASKGHGTLAVPDSELKSALSKLAARTKLPPIKFPSRKAAGNGQFANFSGGAAAGGSQQGQLTVGNGTPFSVPILPNFKEESVAQEGTSLEKANDVSFLEYSSAVNDLMFDVVYGLISKNPAMFDKKRYSELDIRRLVEKNAESLYNIFSVEVKKNVAYHKSELLSYINTLNDARQGLVVLPQLTAMQYRILKTRVDELMSNVSYVGASTGFGGLISKVRDLIMNEKLTPIDEEKERYTVQEIKAEVDRYQKVFNVFKKIAGQSSLMESISYKVAADCFKQLLKDTGFERDAGRLDEFGDYGTFYHLVSNCTKFCNNFAKFYSNAEEDAKAGKIVLGELRVKELNEGYLAVKFAMDSVRSILGMLLTRVNDLPLKTGNAELDAFVVKFKNNEKSKKFVDNRTFLELAVACYALSVNVSFRGIAEFDAVETEVVKNKLIKWLTTPEAVVPFFGGTFAKIVDKGGRPVINSDALLQRENVAPYTKIKAIYEQAQEGGGAPESAGGGYQVLADLKAKTKIEDMGKAPVELIIPKTGTGGYKYPQLVFALYELVTALSNYGRTLDEPNMQARFKAIMKALSELQKDGLQPKVEKGLVDALGKAESFLVRLSEQFVKIQPNGAVGSVDQAYTNGFANFMELVGAEFKKASKDDLAFLMYKPGVDINNLLKLDFDTDTSLSLINLDNAAGGANNAKFSNWAKKEITMGTSSMLATAMNKLTQKDALEMFIRACGRLREAVSDVSQKQMSFSDSFSENVNNLWEKLCFPENKGQLAIVRNSVRRGLTGLSDFFATLDDEIGLAADKKYSTIGGEKNVQFMKEYFDATTSPKQLGVLEDYSNTFNNIRKHGKQLSGFESFGFYSEASKDVNTFDIPVDKVGTIATNKDTDWFLMNSELLANNNEIPWSFTEGGVTLLISAMNCLGEASRTGSSNNVCESVVDLKADFDKLKNIVVNDVNEGDKKIIEIYNDSGANPEDQLVFKDLAITGTTDETEMENSRQSANKNFWGSRQEFYDVNAKDMRDQYDNVRNQNARNINRFLEDLGNRNKQLSNDIGQLDGFYEQCFASVNQLFNEAMDLDKDLKELKDKNSNDVDRGNSLLSESNTSLKEQIQERKEDNDRMLAERRKAFRGRGRRKLKNGQKAGTLKRGGRGVRLRDL